MTRALVLVALLLALPAPAADAQTTLVVTGYGGRWSEVMKKALVEPCCGWACSPRWCACC